MHADQSIYPTGFSSKSQLFLKEVAENSPVPVITTLPEISLEKIIEILKLDNVGGIAGKLVNDNIKEIQALKDLCKDNGIEVSEITAAYQWEDFKKNSDGLLPLSYRTIRQMRSLCRPI